MNASSAKMTAAELVQDHVLRLTFTADDMFPFCAGPRLHRGCRSPGTPMNGGTCAPGSTRCTSTYTACRGTTRPTSSTRSPIVRRQDEKEFGDYRTKRLITGLHERAGGWGYGDGGEGVRGWSGANGAKGLRGCLM